MWTQRVIAHIKCSKTFKFERLYYKQASLNHDDSNYHNFESKFDLIIIIQQIIEMKDHQTIEEINDWKSLTYKQAMNGFYTHKWQEFMNKQMQSFVIINT